MCVDKKLSILDQKSTNTVIIPNILKFTRTEYHCCNNEYELLLKYYLLLMIHNNIKYLCSSPNKNTIFRNFNKSSQSTIKY